MEIFTCEESPVGLGFVFGEAAREDFVVVVLRRAGGVIKHFL